MIPPSCHRRASRLVGLITALAVTWSTSIAEAEPPAAPAPASAEFTTGDWVLSVLAGDVGTVVIGGLPLLGLLGCTAAKVCNAEGAGTAAGMLAVLGGFFGNAAGVYAYGQWTGHDGSYWWSLLGSLGGMLVYGTTAGAFKDIYHPAAIGLLLIVPSLGAAVGYDYSLPDAAPVPNRLSHALIVVDGDEVQPGAPVPSVAPDPESGELWFILPLASGRF